MAITRIRKFGVLLGTGMMLYAVPAMAGFELVAPATPPAVQNSAPPVAAAAPIDAPMPIVPAMPVSSEPLMPMAAMDQAPPPAAPFADHNTGSAEPVYIHRQRTQTLIKAPANEPMDTDALLKATARNADIELAPENSAVNSGSAGALVINPYPLQDSAATGNANVRPSVEQAMMEQSGNLRPVAVPGQTSAVGMAERARISERYADGSGYLALPESSRPQAISAPVLSDMTMTPIPGGEDAPLSGLPQPASVSPAITPAPMMPAPGNTGGYADAVGFGRDLPLPLALSQVIPPGYSYAFGQNVDLAANVSWQGGKPWDQVLNDMLAPSGMAAVIQSNQVTIQKARS